MVDQRFASVVTEEDEVIRPVGDRVTKASHYGERASRAGLAFVLALALIVSRTPAALAEEADGPEAASQEASDGASEEVSYVGADMCAACHPDEAETFAESVHGDPLSDPDRPAAASGCEACHGAGGIHAEEGGGKGVGGLVAFATSESADARSKRCLACHAGDPPRHTFRRSAHALSGVACTDCHSGHTSRPQLLRSAAPTLCYGCHPDVRASFALTEHHRVDEGVLGCLDCHEAHGSANRMALRDTNSRECFRCHGEIEGPFVFEHGAQLTEGCMACHVPHGSTNRHLLLRRQVAQLCYQCHTVTPADHVQPSFRDCTRCHVSIHGSNVNPRFLEQ